jgi:hypothetical protein
VRVILAGGLRCGEAAEVGATGVGGGGGGFRCGFGPADAAALRDRASAAKNRSRNVKVLIVVRPSRDNATQERGS